jgi:hypothetical protein
MEFVCKDAEKVVAYEEVLRKYIKKYGEGISFYAT